MALNKKTKERYFQIFEYRRQGVHPSLITEIMGVSEATVHRAIRWVAENGLHLSTKEDLRVAIAEKGLEIKRLNERLGKLQDGWEETKKKTYPNGSQEITTTSKFSPSVEVSLLRLIQKTQDDINRLKGLYEYLKRDPGSEEDPQELAQEITRTLKQMDRKTGG